MNEIEALRVAMRAAVPVGRGNYVGVGRYLLEIANAKVQRTPMDGRVKESWIVEFKVIQSSNPAHEPGSTVTYIENPQNAGWMGRFKAFLIAAIGTPSSAALSKEDQDTIDDITAALRYDEERKRLGFPENFLQGRRLQCEGSAGTSRAGGQVTNKKWEPAPEVTAAT